MSSHRLRERHAEPVLEYREKLKVVFRYRAALVLLVPLLLGAASSAAIRANGLAGPSPGHSDRAALAYAEAAAAVRRQDCAAAFKALAPLLAGKGPEAGFAQLLTGFYAHACEQVGLRRGAAVRGRRSRTAPWRTGGSTS